MTIEQEKNIFCENIKQLRLRNRLSKKEMAKILNVGIKTINVIESGTIPKRLTVKILIIIQDRFSITPSSLFSSLIF